MPLPAPTTLLLVRHAATMWSLEHRFAGRTDVALSPAVEPQIAELTRALLRYPVSAIRSSPLARCQETIRPLAEILGLPVTLDAGVIERDLGAWEGRSSDELAHEHPGFRYPESAYNERMQVPGAERVDALIERVRGALRRIAAEHPGGTVAVSTHAGVIQAAERHIVENADPLAAWPANGSIHRITYADGVLRLESMSQAATRPATNPPTWAK